jgi:NAD(P)-dependent dehydrogenase (short-subunit alcohol dehydrogenase family)
MNFSEQTFFITGANRGLGLALAREALARGARKVYAAARDPSTVTLPGVVPVRLDVTREDQLAQLDGHFADVTVLINNAGVAELGGFLPEGSLTATRRMLEVNVFGPARVTQVLAPALAANGGGAVLNVLSVASWIHKPLLGAYGATKAAAWALTNSLRHELREQGTRVSGLHVAFIDTDLTKGLDVPKLDVKDVARRAFDSLAAGEEEILIDDFTRQVKQGLNAPTPVYLVP